MGKVNIEDIIDYLDTEMKGALEEAVSNIIPDVDFDRDELFREFVIAVGRKCLQWENVPDSCIKT